MNGLLDAYGRPIKKKALLEETAAPSMSGVRRIWADSVATSLTPRGLASILQSAADGDIEDFMTLAEEMEERDAHYASVLGVRKRKISGIAPVVEPASEDKRDKEIAEAVRDHIAGHEGFADLVEDALDALGKGFSVVEIDWQTEANMWHPRRFKHRDARFFMPSKTHPDELRLRDEANVADGIELAPFKFIVHKARLKSGHYARGGLARLVAFGWMCKAYDVKDWMAFVETFGMPIRIGRYDGSATKEDQAVLMRAVANIGADAAAVIPENMRIDFESATNGTGSGTDVFEKLARWVDEQVSKAVLGQTMTSDDGSSMAQAEVHNDVRLDIAKADARSVCGTLMRDLVAPFVHLNYGADAALPSLRITVDEPEDTAMLLERADGFVSKGLRVKASEVRAKLGFSEPDDDDEVIGASEARPPTETAQNREAETAADFQDEAEADIDDEWEELSEEMFGGLLKELEGAESYADAEAILRAAAPSIPAGTMIGSLVKAAVKSRGIGDATDG